METGAISTASPARAFLFSENFPLSVRKSRQMRAFLDRQQSLETGVRTFWTENSQKSPVESKKTPDFWGLVLETEE